MSKAQRSRTMSRIKSRNNQSTELKLVQIFKKYGIKGWRRGYPLEGQPDFVFPKDRVVIFTDGCFWHGCSRCFHPPKSNVAYWDTKIKNNKKRDRRISASLKNKGWRVIRFKEHTLQNNERYVSQRIETTLKEMRMKQEDVQQK